MKFKNLFITLGLSLAVGLGVGVGLGAKGEAKEAKATISSDSTILVKGKLESVGLTSVDWETGVDLKAGGYAVWNNNQFDIVNIDILTTDSFKFVIDGQWCGIAEFTSVSGTNRFSGSGDICVTSATRYSFYVKEDSGRKIYVSYVKDIDEDFNSHTYTLAGTKLANASDWDPTDTDYDFALSNGNKTATLTSDFVSGQQFKICEDHAWGVSYGFSGATSVASEIVDNGGNFFVKTSGNYTITLNTNEHYQKSTLTIVKNSQTNYRAYSLAGTWDGEHEWDVLSLDYEFSPSNNHRTASVVITFDEDVSFKIVIDHAWANAYGYNSSYVTAVPYAFDSVDAGENFTVAVAGTYVITINLTAQFALESIAITTTDVYNVKVNTTDYALTLKEATEYQTEVLNVTSGQSVKVYKNGAVDNSFTLKAMPNNNVNNSGNVLVDANGVRIYVDLSAKTIFVGGLDFGGYHIIKNATTYISMTSGGEYDGFTQYYSELVSFSVGDKIRFVNTGVGISDCLPEVFDITTINAAGLGDKFQVVEGVLECKTATSAKVYLKLKYHADEVYFGTVDQYIVEADDFAKGFNTAIAAVCDEDGITTVQSALENAWDLQATAFGSLSDEAQTEVKKGSLSTVESVRTFVAKYDSVYRLRKLGSGWDLDNFLNRSYSPSPVVTIYETNNSGIIVIAIVSTITIIGLGAFFFIRKRIEDR